MKNSPSIEDICAKCTHHISVFEGYVGIDRTGNAKLVCSSEKYGLKRDIYCSNGHDCKILIESYKKS